MHIFLYPDFHLRPYWEYFFIPLFFTVIFNGNTLLSLQGAHTYFIFLHDVCLGIYTILLWNNVVMNIQNICNFSASIFISFYFLRSEITKPRVIIF